MHEQLWQKFELLDQHNTLQRAQCVRSESAEDCTITFLNTPYAIDLEERAIYSARKGVQPSQAGFLEQLCILAYLIHCKDILPTHRLVKAESLPGGAFFFRGHHRLPSDKLEVAFGHNPESLYPASRPLGARKCEFGDASVEVLLFPRVPVTFVIWGSDEDFDARASILFDSTVSDQLPLDALHAGVNLAVNAMTKKEL